MEFKCLKVLNGSFNALFLSVCLSVRLLTAGPVPTVHLCERAHRTRPGAPNNSSQLGILQSKPNLINMRTKSSARPSVTLTLRFSPLLTTKFKIRLIIKQSYGVPFLLLSLSAESLMMIYSTKRIKSALQQHVSLRHTDEPVRARPWHTETGKGKCFVWNNLSCR